MIGGGTNRKALTAQRQPCLTLPARLGVRPYRPVPFCRNSVWSLAERVLRAFRALPRGFGHGGGGRGGLILVRAEAYVNDLTVG